VKFLVTGRPSKWGASATAVRHRPTYSQANGWAPLTYAVQHAEDPGRVLMVSVPAAHHGNWMLMPSMAIRPATVAASVDVDARGVAILLALTDEDAFA
jgi:hypothetical protein